MTSLFQVAGRRSADFAALTNTFRANRDHHATAGEVSVFIDNTGLKDDLRWQGRMETAPQSILDLLGAVRRLETLASA